MWNGNVLLHEWKYELIKRPQLVVAADGTMQYDNAEPTENITTWHYELNSFTPCAKEENGKFYSIISDYLGTPTHAFDEAGKKVWERQLDCYGRIRIGNNKFVPFLYPGQYVDEETGLAYNRFRYYSPETGNYLSQDPIGLNGGNALYSYVSDTNHYIDFFGLNPIGIIDPDLAKIAKQGHDVLRDANGNPTRGFNNSTVAVAEVDVNGKTQIFASGNGASLSPAQRIRLEELGVPKENIFSGAQYRADAKLDNHAERVIQRNLPEGSIIKRWGISWAGNQKNEMCGNCKQHFGYH